MASRKTEEIVDLRNGSSARSAAEARELIKAMRRDIASLESFLATEQKSIERRGLSSKRVARLRLISDDLKSACRFAAKSVKS